ALQTLPAGQVGMARLTDHLPQALLVSSPVLTRLLIDDVLSEVLALRPREAEVLLDTLEAALECDGSPTQAARRLHIHRNTALNRLRRIETLTRRRLDRPHDRLRLHLAVLGLRMGRASPDGPLSRGEREREPRADPSR
ncbi:MAG TPA: helix-turn-helix domain-containing protein, partial [Mycobacteriales bacterium]|nr:helix-turn-helix domain-containing protein [Mycobacteriales bacterium]